MTKTIPAVKARQQFGTILNEVDLKGTNVIIERDGKPMAVVVSIKEYETWQRRRQNAVDRFVKLADEVSERIDKQLKKEGKTQADLEKLISEEVQAVRKARAARKQP